MQTVHGPFFGTNAEFAELPTSPIPEQFALVGDVLDDTKLRKKLKRCTANGSFVLIRDLAAPSLARLIPGESQTMRLEFQRFFRDRCKKSAEAGVREIAVEFDLVRALNESDFANALRLTLRSCFGILEEYSLRLLLPIRLPAVVDAPNLLSYDRFRQELLYPKLGWLWELTDNEPLSAMTAAELHHLRFYCDRWILTGENQDGIVDRSAADAIIQTAGNDSPPPRRVFFPAKSGNQENNELC